MGYQKLANFDVLPDCSPVKGSHAILVLCVYVRPFFQQKLTSFHSSITCNLNQVLVAIFGYGFYIHATLQPLIHGFNIAVFCTLVQGSSVFRVRCINICTEYQQQLADFKIPLHAAQCRKVFPSLSFAYKFALLFMSCLQVLISPVFTASNIHSFVFLEFIFNCQCMKEFSR